MLAEKTSGIKRLIWGLMPNTVSRSSLFSDLIGIRAFLARRLEHSVKLSPYLSGLKVSEKALAHTSARFDGAVDALGAILAEPIALSFRRQLAGEIADVWISDARRTLERVGSHLRRGLSRSDATTEDEETQSFMLRIADRLSTSEDDEAHLREEAGRCGRELAQRALSRWFHVLEREDATANEGVILNANLLPQTGVLNDIAIHVEAQAYGIDPQLVSRALRDYWDALFDSNTATCEPLELGPNLWVLPETSDEPRSYRLFHQRERAVSFVTLRERVLPEPATAEVLIRRALASIQKPEVANSAAELVEVMQNSLPACSVPEIWRKFGIDVCDRKSGRQDTYRNAFATSVVSGLDSVLSVSALPEDEAMKLLQANSSSLRKNLRKYANKNQIPFGAVSSAYASSVAYAILSRNESELAGQQHIARSVAESIESLYGSYINVLSLAKKSARELASTTMLGMGRVMPTTARGTNFRGKTSQAHHP